MVDGRPERDEAEVRAFIWGMHAIARDLAPLVAAKLDLKAVRHLLDLGGGPATYAITFAQANPELKATVFDLPMPIEIARENIANNGLTDRINTLAGNFLKTTSARATISSGSPRSCTATTRRSASRSSPRRWRP